jgi:hypothetical protein|eukprot:COSAG01_NODE_14706_length_1420_cov_0.891749_1_plen_43_part_00
MLLLLLLASRLRWSLVLVLVVLCAHRPAATTQMRSMRPRCTS